MIQAAITEIVEHLSDQFLVAGWGMSCNNFGVEQGGKVITRSASGTSERAYIGIEDQRGTYMYFRENSNAAQIRSASLGACQNGQLVTIQLRAVAVSNNLQNTPQNLADKLFIDLNKAAFPKKFIAGIGEISLDASAQWTNHAEIMLAETGGTRKDGFRVVLAALDFELSFVIQNCTLHSPKLC